MDNFLSSGHLFKCVKEVGCETTEKTGKRFMVEVGEIVEFRYPCDANFRTHDGLCLYLKKHTFLEHFKIFGKIYEQVRFNNRNTTKEILDAKLYEIIKIEEKNES